MTSRLVLFISILCLTSSIKADSFAECFDEAVEHLTQSNCSVDDFEERRDCLTNILANSILPCFKFASDLNLVHLLVPEMSGSFLKTLRQAAESFRGFSGNEIVIHGFPVDAFVDHLTQMIESKDLFYSGWILPSSQLARFYHRDALLDVTGNLTNNSAFNFQDIAKFVRNDLVSIQDQVVGVPISGDLILLYYRKDIFDANNVSRPETWEQVLSIAEQFNGTDLDGDGLEDFGTCLSNITGSVAVWIKSIMAPYFQSLGTQQGMMFGSESLQPLFNTDAMAWVFELFRGLANFGPYHDSTMTVESTMELFQSGKCLMTLGSKEVFHKYAKRGLDGDWLGVTELPGSWYVFDRSLGSISRCTTTLCPHGRLDSQRNIVNFAPYNGNRSLVAAVNSLATKSSSEVMLTFLSYLGGKSLSFEFVASVEEVQPFRWSHLQIDRWVNRDWEYNSTLDFINAMSRSFVSGNIALEPGIPSTLDIDRLLESHGDRFIREPGTGNSILASLEAEIASQIRNYGFDDILEIYRSSLGLRPAMEEEPVLEPESSEGTNSTTGIIVGLLIPLILLFVGMMWCLYFVNFHTRQQDGRLIKPPTAGLQTSLVITDIQDSTTLWETIDADEMDEALHLHNECIRQILRRNKGYESATEGDAFILAFHTAIDAVRFCIETQLALLDVNWPNAISQSIVSPPVPLNESENDLRTVIDSLAKRNNPDQSVSNQDLTITGLNTVQDMNSMFWETVETQHLNEARVLDSPTPGFLFKGLRVRMGVYTGIQDSADVIMNNASGRMMYSGVSMTLTKAISEVGHGGQIIISESTYKAAGLEKLLEDIHVLHLGEYQLSDTLPHLQFYEIVPKTLVGRLLHFPALKGEALTPAWHQAPSGTVCLSFSFVVGAETLNQWNAKIFRESLEIYESIAKEQLMHYRGYQVEAADGLLLVAFADPACAIAWALTLHDHLSRADWPVELLRHPLCERLSVHSIDRSGMVHPREIKGLRLKTGIEQGPAKSTPHPTTGFMAYRGKVINRSARITKFANGGQVLTSMGVWKGAKESQLMNELSVKWASMGTQKLKGVVETVDICHLFLDTSRSLNQTSIDIGSVTSTNFSSDGEY